ncbi:aminoglycoside phosphotransferase family protein [Planotetraspora sp. A-T 1434]|uniref:phosphotransferase family protein n=1 Tax=Planotetraspora sp. A-T 1434 TaxID=2979219 RepID=UPI0021C19CF2|nr:aminoglycoside phosphotransferase family protein [Planotetraspora sp. A-T 1434]MCT9933377.1 aminoglycoside phosphotransferase family protein [Planotetraspora sp. A-T 1434]
MDSRTKRRLSPAQLDALALDALGAGVVSSEELADGFANAVWLLGLADGRRVVLKVGPPPDLRLLTYERNLLRTEAMVYSLAAPLGLPLPSLLHAAFDDPRLGGDYLILSALDGVPWNRASLDPAEEAALRFEVGRHLARLHSIPGTGVFGYPYAGLTGRTWREAFLAMTGAMLEDAVHYGTPLPVSLVEIAGLVHANAAALDEVVTPSLIHFDVWPGNVFLTEDNRIQALIDHERAFWGDPLAEFITPTIFGEVRDDDPLLVGYRAAGGTIRLTGAAEIRIALYQVYLYLILLVENGPRQYPEESYARIRDLATQSLARSLDVLRR